VSEIQFDFWPCARPMTRKWGSGQIWDKICKSFGEPDVAFGKTDGIPNGVFFIDHEENFEWRNIPFTDNQFKFGYWDPPYDSLYKQEGQEIWRVCQRLAILHITVYPTSWFKHAMRTGMIAVTFGPLKQIRILQIFNKIPSLPFKESL